MLLYSEAIIAQGLITVTYPKAQVAKFTDTKWDREYPPFQSRFYANDKNHIDHKRTPYHLPHNKKPSENNRRRAECLPE